MEQQNVSKSEESGKEGQEAGGRGKEMKLAERKREDGGRGGDGMMKENRQT